IGFDSQKWNRGAKARIPSFSIPGRRLAPLAFQFVTASRISTVTETGAQKVNLARNTSTRHGFCYPRRPHTSLAAD
ncbi:MAG: hypothetical protein ACREIT_03970, partial [Tepidisphaeraceae bacterium]